MEIFHCDIEFQINNRISISQYKNNLILKLISFYTVINIGCCASHNSSHKNPINHSFIYTYRSVNSISNKKWKKQKQYLDK